MHQARTLSIALALALSLTSPAGAADEEEMAGNEMSADATWMFPKAKPGTYTGYMVFAIDQEPSQGPDAFSIAIVMRGPCRVEGNSTSCQGKQGGFFELKPGQLQVASDWSGASLSLGKRDERVSMIWTAEGIPFPRSTGTFGSSSSSNGKHEEFETRGFGISRQASVEGTMFGRTLGADGLEDPAGFYRGQYRGEYRRGDRTITIGSVRWHLPA